MTWHLPLSARSVALCRCAALSWPLASCALPRWSVLRRHASPRAAATQARSPAPRLRSRRTLLQLMR
jgi:hypothetical protein